MPVIEIITVMNAPIGTCFDLSRDISIHQQSVAFTRERAIAGRVEGLCEAGDTVTWEAVHFGVRQTLSVEIIEVKYPYYFEDRMTKGAFKSFYHKHFFTTENDQTIVRDEFNYVSPLNLLGKLADLLFLKKYMTSLLLMRNNFIKEKAEKLYQQSLLTGQ